MGLGEGPRNPSRVGPKLEPRESREECACGRCAARGKPSAEPSRVYGGTVQGGHGLRAHFRERVTGRFFFFERIALFWSFVFFVYVSCGMAHERGPLINL